MSSPAARVFSLPAPTAQPGAAPVRLGPATVLRTLPTGAVEARLEQGREAGQVVVAQMAMPIPYEPNEGDVLLVIGTPDAPDEPGGHYVIGVLAGTGRARLEVQGDLSLRSIGGELSLRADKAVRLEAPELGLLGRRLGMVADAVVQRFSTVRQRVTELLDVHAGESQTTVDGASLTQAKSATVLTRDAVVINGKAIHLG